MLCGLRAGGKLQVVWMQTQVFFAQVERVAAVMRGFFQTGNVVTKARAPGPAGGLIRRELRRSGLRPPVVILWRFGVRHANGLIGCASDAVCRSAHEVIRHATGVASSSSLRPFPLHAHPRI